MLRYDFLEKAHEILQPRIYLEIGVQLGTSLVIAHRADLAIGVDPYPQVLLENHRNNQAIYPMRSGEFFTQPVTGAFKPDQGVDMAFIDGSHLFEDALDDFINVEQYLAGPDAVVFFDDVLPYSNAIATRVQPPGDWTGDVWKVVEVLRVHRPDLRMTLIDVVPTGLLMVQSARESTVPTDMLRDNYDKIVASWLATGEAVPMNYINRSGALSGEEALDLLRERGR